MLGDNIYGSDTPKDFQNKFELPYKALLDSKVKFHAALGNHDSPIQASYKPFNMDGRRYYTFKPTTTSGFLSSTAPRWTSANWNGWRRSFRAQEAIGRSPIFTIRSTPPGPGTVPIWRCGRLWNRCS